MTATITLYTDGGSSPNPGPGGWGVVVVNAQKQVLNELSGGESHTTNNRMELTAAIQALADQPANASLVLYTDSTYVRSGITQWIAGWIRKNWMRGPRANEPVKNADLWKELHQLNVDRNVDWRWLKGHAGHTFNERADELASAAILEQRGEAAGDNELGVSITDQQEAAYEAADVQILLKVRSSKDQAKWLALVMEREDQHQLDGHEIGTANRAELRAGLEVLRSFDRDISLGIRCGDYFAKGCSDWLASWKSRRWTTAAGDPVKNKDLWKLVDGELSGRSLAFARLPKTGPLALDLKRRLGEL